MKKILAMLIIAFTLSVAITSAQTIPNNGFENVNANGTLSNWGNVYLRAIRIDSSGGGGSPVDSLVYDGRYYYASSNDAQTGAKALELRNAWNFTTHTGTAGAVGVDDDSVFSSWGLFNLVPVGDTVGSDFRPVSFSFYYKYLPVNGDSAYAQVTFWDSAGNQVGEGLEIIAGTVNNYSLATVPVAYVSQEAVAFYSLTFSAFYSSNPEARQPAFGTRFLIDDVTFNNKTSTATNTVESDVLLNIYPNPVMHVLHIVCDAGTGVEFYICNSLGQSIVEGSIASPETAISLEKIDAGFYNLVLINGQKRINRKLVVTK